MKLFERPSKVKAFVKEFIVMVSGLAMAVEGITSSFGPNHPKTAVFMIIFGFAITFMCGQKLRR